MWCKFKWDYLFSFFLSRNLWISKNLDPHIKFSWVKIFSIIFFSYIFSYIFFSIFFIFSIIFSHIFSHIFCYILLIIFFSIFYLLPPKYYVTLILVFIKLLEILIVLIATIKINKKIVGPMTEIYVYLNIRFWKNIIFLTLWVNRKVYLLY